MRKSYPVVEVARLFFSRHPVLYAEKVLGMRLTEAQKRILETLGRHKKVMVTSGHGVGKTTISAVASLWFYDCFAPSIVLTTAPTEHTLRDALWKEIRARGRWNVGEILPKGLRAERRADWFLSAVVARDINAFVGRHSENLLLVFDEMCGIDEAFWVGGESMMAGRNAKWLVIGNPHDKTSPAYAHYLSGEWEVIELDCREHENVKAGLMGKPAPFPGAVTLDWVTDRVREWCERGSPEQEGAFEWLPGSGEWWIPTEVFETRVMGRWATIGETTLFPSVWIVRARERDGSQWVGSDVFIGVDVARFGEDATTYCVRRGGDVLEIRARYKTEVPDVVKEVFEICHKYKAARVIVDDVGVGGGVVDGLSRMGVDVIPFNGGAKPEDRERFVNRRGESYFGLRERLKEGMISLKKLRGDVFGELLRQMSAVRYTYDEMGRVKLEPKEVIRKRIGRSPDHLDALVMAFSESGVRAEVRVRTGGDWEL
jgi:hypothetical protein